jgi:hypothetical protein
MFGLCLPKSRTARFPPLSHQIRPKFIQMIQIYQKKLMKAAQIDENGANLGGAACWGGGWGCLGAPQTVPSHAQPHPVKVLPLYMLDVPFPVL